MSAHPDEHADAHDHAHDFDGEPVQTLPDDEPRTPNWLPMIGVGLTVLLAVYFLAQGSPADADTAAASAKPVAVAPPPATAAAAAPAPSPSNAPSARMQLTPDQIKEIQQRIKTMQQNGGAPAPSAKAK